MNAWLFPGHGAQYVGMGWRLMQQYRCAAVWLERAQQVSEQPLVRILRCGPEQALRQPNVLEPLLAAVSCAWIDVMHELGNFPQAVAGYSAGELPALYAAGVLDADAVMRIAHVRGAVLQQAATEYPGGMLAVSGIDEHRLCRMLRGAGQTAWLSAVHTPWQFTVSGAHDSLAAVASTLCRMGVGAAYLDVAGPWHTPVMCEVADRIVDALTGVSAHSPVVAVYPGSLGQRCIDPGRLLQLLGESIRHPVMWRDAIEAMVYDGSCRFTELGPGGTLFGLLGQMKNHKVSSRQFAERRGRSAMLVGRIQ